MIKSKCNFSFCKTNSTRWTLTNIRSVLITHSMARIYVAIKGYVGVFICYWSEPFTPLRVTFVVDEVIRRTNIISSPAPFCNSHLFLETIVWCAWLHVYFSTQWFTEVCSLWVNDPDSKVHGANMGPAWVLLAPHGSHVGPMNLAIRGQQALFATC